MRKTPQEFRRESVKELFVEVLRGQELKLAPYDISVKEFWNSDFTVVEMVIEEHIGGLKRCKEIKSEQAKGFVDGMFKACCEQYVAEHASLNNLRLVDYQVKPNFKNSRSAIGSDAKTEVTLMVEVSGRGVSEFSYTSRSILYSSFAATLDAFEFYINCDSTFRKLNLIIEDAQSRNRGDIAEKCRFQLSKLTEANAYEKKNKH